MCGHVLYLDTDFLEPINTLIEQLTDSDGSLPVDKVKKILLPILFQAAMEEQHAIIRKMYDNGNGISKEGIASLLGYDKSMIQELLDMDEDEYDYSYLNLKSFSL